MQHVALVFLTHRHGFIHPGNFEVAFLVEGHFHAGVEFAAIGQAFQQLKLIPVAIHIVHRGDAEGGGIGNAALQKILIKAALGRRCCRLRIFPGCHAEPFAPAGWGYGLHQHIGGGLTQFAGCQAIRIKDNFIADGKIAAPHDVCRLERPGVGPHGVVIKAAHNKWNIRHDAVEKLAGNGTINPQALMGDALGDDDIGLWTRLAILRNCVR